MNSVSWFLYAADVLSALGVFGTVCMLGTLVTMVFVTAFQICEREESPRFLRWALPLWIFAGVIICLIPSKNTMYAIAASEVGEKIVKSETVQGIASDATKALQQWIKKQIEPGKK